MPTDDGDSHGQRYPLDRRTLLALSGGAVVGLAGCGGDGDGDGGQDEGTTTTETTTEEVTTEAQKATTADETAVEESAEPVDPRLDSYIPTQNAGTNVNVNPYSLEGVTSGGNADPTGHGYMSPKLSIRNTKNEIIYELIDDVQLENDGCRRVITFEEDFNWWDGTPVNAEDYMAQSALADWVLNGGPSNSPISRQLRDTYTVVESFETPQNAFSGLDIGGVLHTKRDWAAPWLERFRGASTEDETNQVIQDLVETQIGVQEYGDEGLGCGLWRPVRVTDTEYLFEKVEDHPWAGRTNLQQLRFQLIASDQKVQELIKRDEFDVLLGNSSVDEDAPESLGMVTRLTAGGGRTFYLNLDGRATQYRAVRQAILHYINTQQLIETLSTALGGGSFGGEPVKYQGGMADPFLEVYCGRDWLENNLIHYGYDESRPERARGILQDNGFSIEDGTWVGPDGELEPIRVVAANGAVPKNEAIFLADRLEQFGFPVEQAVSESQRVTSRFRESQEYELLESWFHNRHPRPAMHLWQGHSTIVDYPLSDIANFEETEGCVAEVPDFELNREAQQRNGASLRPKLPEPGTETVESGSEEFDLVAATLELEFAGPERTRELARKMAWYRNWNVTTFQTYYEKWGMAGDTQNFDFPSEDSPYFYVDRFHNHINSGQITGVGVTESQ